MLRGVDAGAFQKMRHAPLAGLRGRCFINFYVSGDYNLFIPETTKKTTQDMMGQSR